MERGRASRASSLEGPLPTCSMAMSLIAIERLGGERGGDRSGEGGEGKGRKEIAGPSVLTRTHLLVSRQRGARVMSRPSSSRYLARARERAEAGCVEGWAG